MSTTVYTHGATSQQKLAVSKRAQKRSKDLSIVKRPLVNKVYELWALIQDLGFGLRPECFVCGSAV